MKKLAADLRFDEDALERGLSKVADDIDESLPDAEDVREKLAEAGFEIKQAEAETPPDEAGYLAADSSFAKKELRFNVLWGVHSVCVYGVFDGSGHDDPLVGRGVVPYRDLAYSSRTSFGCLKPYSDVDARLEALRLGAEARLLNETAEEVEGEGRRVDYILFDGSLTTLSVDESVPESAAALAELDKLKSRNVVGLVEDSHVSDISRCLGFEYTNALILDASLAPLEYVAVEQDGFEVCYIKLPAKKLSHLGGRESPPFVARWEFKRGLAERHLPLLLGAWSHEDDITHPQTYPVRVADHLTRKINVAGILDDFAAEKNIAPQFRSLREA